jgi:hypothetical protein
VETGSAGATGAGTDLPGVATPAVVVPVRGVVVSPGVETAPGVADNPAVAPPHDVVAAPGETTGATAAVPQCWHVV